MHTRFCLCPPGVESLVLPILWKSCNQIPLAFKVRFPGDSQSLLLNPQARKPDVELTTFTTVGKHLWYYCSPLCGLPTWWVWDLILSFLHSFYHLTVASSLSLDMGYHFLLCSNILLSMVVQQLVAIFVLSQEMSTPPSSLLS